MRTEELVDGLVADGGTRPLPLMRGLTVAVVVGVAATAVSFFAFLGPRPDFARAAETLRFLLKFVEAGALATAALVSMARLVRPAADPRLGVVLLLIAAALLAGAVAVELLVMPAASWGARLVGSNWYHCLTLVPLFAIPPFAALMLAARHGAPTRPRLTGAVVGLAAAGIGAFFYAANCTDDSPLFVATWYTLATAFVAGVGAWIGGRVLRW